MLRDFAGMRESRSLAWTKKSFYILVSSLMLRPMIRLIDNIAMFIVMALKACSGTGVLVFL